MATYIDIVLCRSDHGDGGWSLHHPDATDDGIASGEFPPLVSGDAEYDENTKCWSRPNDADYAAALDAIAEE